MFVPKKEICSFTFFFFPKDKRYSITLPSKISLKKSVLFNGALIFMTLNQYGTSNMKKKKQANFKEIF